MASNNTAGPWRRYLRFSMRALIVLVLLIGGCLGWLARGARIQRDAVAAIKDAGGNVEFDWQWHDGNRDLTARPAAPDWLVDYLGVDYFGHVIAVRLPETATSAHIAHVGRLPRLQRLVLFSRVSETDMAHLAGLKELSFLDLGGTQLTDAGMAHLKGLTNLTQLWIGVNKISDAGLVHLEGLTNLREIDLEQNKVTDVGLEHLQLLTKLEGLNLDATNVTDAGLVHLKGLTRLKTLLVPRTVTEVGVKKLKHALPSLIVISL